MRARRDNRAYCRKYFASPHGKAGYKRRTHGYRQQALMILGGVCCRCGFGREGADDHLALQVDHKIPVRRKTTGTSRRPVQVYLKIIRGEVDQFQLLCANCHAIKTAKEDPLSAPASELPLFFGAPLGRM